MFLSQINRLFCYINGERTCMMQTRGVANFLKWGVAGEEGQWWRGLKMTGPFKLMYMYNVSFHGGCIRKWSLKGGLTHEFWGRAGVQNPQNRPCGPERGPFGSNLYYKMFDQFVVRSGPFGKFWLMRGGGEVITLLHLTDLYRKVKIIFYNL